MRPLISVIIPVYNHEDKLIAALRSIELQTYRPIEVVIVDDGSQREISISKIQFPNDMDVVLYRQKNKGAPAARNKGFELSKGECVIFWDADLVGKPDMLEKMYLALESNSDASYSYSNFYWGKKKMPAGAFDSDKLRKMNYITTTSLIRRDNFSGFDESLKRFQDWDLWLSLLEHGKSGVWIDEYLFTITPGGTMSTWLPSFAYRAPWRYLPWWRGSVNSYEEGRGAIREKYEL